MKKLIQKTVLVTLLAMTSMPMLANATERRPDVQFNIQNNTNHAVVFHTETYCADMPGFTVPARSTFSYWGEPMDHGECTFDMKRIILTAEGYDLDFVTHATFTITPPTYNEKWKYKMNKGTGIGLADAHYDREDLYLTFIVSE